MRDGPAPLTLVSSGARLGLVSTALTFMSITDRTRKLLWGRAGNRCALCRCELAADPTGVDFDAVVGDECHIIAQEPGGPRSDPTCPPEQLHDYENLILLCKTHHKQVDSQYRTYSVTVLRDLKRKHEEYIREATKPLHPRDYNAEFFSSSPTADTIEKKVGIPWSERGDITAAFEVVRFRGQLLAKTRTEDANGPTWHELYRLPTSLFVVYTEHVHRFDYCVTSLWGANMYGKIDPPLTLDAVQEQFPMLATKAGFPRIRNL